MFLIKQVNYIEKNMRKFEDVVVFSFNLLK